jgi:hypothetical protein
VIDRPTKPAIAPASVRTQGRTLALSQWENEGGAGQTLMGADASSAGDVELEQQRIRLIALENLVIALLAEATDGQRTLALEMGDFISPRDGYTPHPLTLRAAEAMRSLVDRADRFRPDPQT